jgi:predicted regulator of Ras-like GTPase activity (Roadblock/LC7/MglB family)
MLPVRCAAQPRAIPLDTTVGFRQLHNAWSIDVIEETISMALEGNLEEFNIVAVLQTIASGHMTGTLTVWDAVNKAHIAFAQGLIIHAEATLEADRIGEILVRTRRISRTQLEKATSAQLRHHSGQRLGQILLEMNLVSEDDLAMAVQIQILEIMSRLLLWSRGRWNFQFQEPDSNDVMPAGAMTVEEIISGQIVLLDDLDPLYNKSEMLDEVYTIVPGRNKDNDGERIILEGDEWAVLSAFDGKASVREVARKTNLDVDQVCQVVSDLLAVRLLAPVDPRRAADADPLVESFPDAPEAPAVPLPLTSAGLSDTFVVGPVELESIEEVLRILLARTEGREVCLIDSTGSLIARAGGTIHSTYPSLFALAAGIFASWQELGRCLGESKASTLLYQGAGLNICLSPVASQAILMTLYQQTSTSGLVNFWTREASVRIGRLIAAGAAAQRSARNGSGELQQEMNGEFRAEAARQMEDLFPSQN